MRLLSVSLVVLSSMALVSCASFSKKPPPPAPEAEEPALPPKAEVPNDGVERVDNSNLPPEKKKGFLTKLAKNLGSDNSVPNAGPCPAVRVLYDSSRFVEIEGANKYENVGFTGEIQNVHSRCRYVGDDPIEMEITLDLALGKGPKSTGDYKDVKYWVAVTRKDIAPIEKRELTGRVFFPKDQDRVRFLAPSTNITIPRANNTVSGANFEIIVGFELDEKQLEFNRNGIRFKIDAGVK